MSASKNDLNASIVSEPEADVEVETVYVNKPEEKKPTAYAWFVLFCVFIVRAIH
jgi:hypothetical protein|tara:strand:- start:17 stop:178 length:162 start_codon:yes stop_codon:yes gene_type:complete